MVSQAVVIATGVSADGRREVLGCAVGDSETSDFLTAFLRTLVAAATRTIFAQPTGPLVRAQVETIALMLEPQLPAVATMPRDAREEITAFADFPEAHWRKVWSTNSLAR